jgi:hypothetical protein
MRGKPNNMGVGRKFKKGLTGKRTFEDFFSRCFLRGGSQ